MDFLNGNGIIVYFAIFFGKIVEVTLDTLRIVLVNRGKRIPATMISFVISLIWIYIVSSIITDLSGNLLKAIVYASAYALGNYLGITIENKLAIGFASLQVIVRETEGYRLANILREHKFGVTVMQGESYNYRRAILLIHLKRKRINDAISLINDNVDDAVVSINDIKTVYGGFVRGR